MEILDNNKEQNKCCHPVLNPKNIFLGVILVLVGVVWLLRNFELINYRVFDVFFSWEMLLVIIGLYLFTLRRWVGGFVMVVIGGAFLLTNMFGVDIPVGKVIVPLVFVGAGVAVLFGRRG